jgi:hypothetical protein
MLAGQSEQSRLLSRPIGIEWAGWRTDTATLGRNGWDIAVDFRIERMSYSLILRHKVMSLYAMTNVIEIQDIISSPHYSAEHMPVFHVVCVAPRIQLHQVPVVGPVLYREIDPNPQINTSRISSIEDLNIFAQAMPGSKGEVLVDGADMTVVEHLEAIKRLQSAKQKEIRDRILRSRESGNEVDPGAMKHRSNVVALVHYERDAA